MCLISLKTLLVSASLLKIIESFLSFILNCAVKSQVTNEVLLQGNVGPDGLYSFSNIKLHHLVFASFALACISTFEKSYVTSCNRSEKFIVNPCTSTRSLWHDRLGHPNSHVL